MVIVAAVQPKTYRFNEEFKNIEKAEQYIKEAVKHEAKLVAFPEGYPGPYSGPVNYSPVNSLSKLAREHGVFISAGYVKDAGNDNYFIIHTLIDDGGQQLFEYHRVQLTPKAVNDVLLNGKVAIPGDKLEVVHTKLGNIGMIICSEIYSTELSRILALKGADIILAPVGGMIYELSNTWKTVAWTRAIENLVYTIINQNLYGMEDGIAQISGPENILGELRTEGILYADLDLQRLSWLRSHDESLDLPKNYRVIPGLIRWRRPEIYSILTESVK